MKYVLFGGGDFAIEVANYLKDIHGGSDDFLITDIVSISMPRIEDFSELLGHRPEVKNQLEEVECPDQKYFVICVGNPSIRRKAMAEIKAIRGRLASVVHPRAYISATAKLGEGTIVCPLVFVGPFAEIGENCALNVGAVVGHDVKLGDCAVLSPGANINGHGRIGVAAFLGAGAIINPKIELGSYSKLSAGSVLSKSVGDGFLMHGNPAEGRQMIKVPLTEK